MTIEVDDPGPRTPVRRGELDEGQAMDSLVLELQAEFPSLPGDQVSVLVQCLWSHYDSAPVRDFVVLLVRKQAKEELSDHLGPAEEAPARSPLPAPRRWGSWQHAPAADNPV
ncbi:hypothetical protein ASG88_21650 [Nocardioides sp. Soil777]|uniref:three-helix bundle dimerization domain-containing protein n=1 Tax=Nocardioides sp. Soil777 TaxID=1736409 RepID=UPI0007037EC3|nr:hypothetical protein [Nocardioides sp. Soil777]KRF04413.1 hypothetical protein ASG88_21650 [Nocardioides sp. Soil777]